MLACTLVTVVIDGRRVDASEGARLERGVVVAPLDPFVRDVAERITNDGPEGPGRGYTIVRGSRRISIRIPGAGARDDVAAETPFVPLAAIARALGASVDYDARSRTIVIATTAEPLVTMTPFATYAPPPGPRVTFAPKETPAPVPVVTGIPHPRRTPIVVRSLVP
jgi:hypothetical protein